MSIDLTTLDEYADTETLNFLDEMSTLDRVSLWNKVADKLPPNKYNSDRKKVLLSQLARIQEELDEAIKAVNEHNEIEMLDAACDLDVTVAGYIYLLDVKDYDNAIKAVLDNNDDKFYAPCDVQSAVLRVNELNLTGDEHCLIGTSSDDIDLTNLSIEELEEHNALFSIHRKKDDKICKPSNFKAVDLTHYI